MNTTDFDILFSNLTLSNGAKIYVWSTVAIGFVSCSFIGCNVLLDSNKIRWNCFILAFLTLGMAVANGLEAAGILQGALYCDLLCISALLFNNLMVFITLDLGGKFYGPEERVNGLYWASVVATILTNMVFIGSLVIHHADSSFHDGVINDHIARMCVPVVIFISIVYAFYPVVVVRTDVDHKLAAVVVAVGVWFLTGMSLLSVLYFITLVTSIVFPFLQYYELNVVQNSIEAFLRFAILDFYSTQPSTKIILIITKQLSPHLTERSSNDKYGLRLGVAVKLQGDDQSAFTSNTEIV